MSGEEAEGDIQIKETKGKSNFTTETLEGSYELWQKLSTDVLRVHHNATNDFLTEEAEATEQKRLEWDFSQPSTRIVLLRGNDQELVGFTYAKPHVHTPDVILRHQNQREMRSLGLSKQEYSEIYDNAAEVGWTVVLEKDRGKGGWTRMMDRLEAGLRSEQNYIYLVQIVRDADYFSKKVKKRYEGRIEYEDKLISEVLGSQSYFRVRL